LIRSDRRDDRATRTNDEQKTFELAAGDMLFGGDVAETEAESFVCLGFDAAKAAKLDESSAAEIPEAGEKLEASLLRRQKAARGRGDLQHPRVRHIE
jgi:hypothetical protein